MGIGVLLGVDVAGTSAKKPTNAHEGALFYATDTNELYVYSATRGWVVPGRQDPVARTATSGGLTTAIIPDGGAMWQMVQVTSGNATHIIVLPPPTPGKTLILNVGANGYELRSSDPATIAINGGAGAEAESAIVANSTVIAICISATAWKAFYLDADSDLAKVEAAA